ncbi:pituitary tumor-transforming gene 1 protein-interacting protein [Antennarius striatus]|uniref:pituitary tumor-transforming gene 1 protein-interacting protein n=1 Tax=Antennarius striatus TaxID=241820 RepID=UPI0035ADCEA0
MPSILTTRTPSWFVLCAAVLCVSFVSHGECQSSPTPPTPCSVSNSCETCVPHRKCLWCFSTNNCTEYPVSWLLPPVSQCPLSQARWALCWMSFEALVILLGVLGGVILVSITVCCCCCCCRCHKKRQSRPDRDEELFNRKREEMRQRSEERKQDRKERQDEIRRKYGLIGDKDHPYSKFENE